MGASPGSQLRPLPSRPELSVISEIPGQVHSQLTLLHTPYLDNMSRHVTHHLTSLMSQHLIPSFNMYCSLDDCNGDD